MMTPIPADPSPSPLALTPRQRADFAATLMAAADAAREAIRPHFRTTGPVENKAGDGRFDPVTEADRAAEQAIRAVISSRHPDHSIIGEEFGTAGGRGDFTWVIDPIDGTRAFIAGAATWGTLIGMGTGTRPVLGLMDQAHVGERFLGLAGVSLSQGPGGTRVLSTSAVTQVGQAILAATAPDMFTAAEFAAFSRLSQTARLTRYGLDCTAYCLLAAGHVDLVVESDLKIYDIYPLIPIIEGAGGVVTDWQGARLTGGGHVIAAATPALHAEALAILSAVGGRAV
ncbi:MAG: histidinol-phosphatase [Alphaproteobacteria bacterium]